MPQVFQVLCCYSCNMFQVQQVKKSNKWQCKVCNEKQSLKKAFKVGAAPDCRSLVQELNMQRGRKKVLQEENPPTEDSDSCEEPSDASEYEKYTSAVNENGETHDYEQQFASEIKLEHGNFINALEENTYKNAGVQNRKRYFPDSQSFKMREEDKFMQRNRYSENLLPSESPICSWDVGENYSEVSEKHSEVSEFVDAKSDHILQKHSLETKLENCSHSLSVPPVKKNRGYQMIKYAASKLN